MMRDFGHRAKRPHHPLYTQDGAGYFGDRIKSFASSAAGVLGPALASALANQVVGPAARNAFAKAAPGLLGGAANPVGYRGRGGALGPPGYKKKIVGAPMDRTVATEGPGVVIRHPAYVRQ
jgi:hypothetical protein